LHLDIAEPTRPRRSDVTSVDVAREAGVSQATVSLVMSGKAAGRISAATAETVRRCARELGYRPNVAARALRSGAASAVGLVVSDVTHPFFGLTLRGAQRAAWEAGHVVVLIDDAYGAAWGDGSVEALRSGTIDGFLFFAADPPASLKASDSPPVVVVEAHSKRFPHVTLDIEPGIDAILDHLHDLGHRRIGYLRSAVPGETFERRHARWSEHLRRNGVDPEAMPTAHSRFHADATIAAGLELLERRGDATAVICDDDVLAAGLVAAARQAGVDVPGELSIAGFDDLDLAKLSAPPLTTVRLDPEALGAAAFELLHARLRGEEPASRVLPVELVVRESTGPAPGA
jgi:DNA-binding LacI/PurR family transcriptional regulator